MIDISIYTFYLGGRFYYLKRTISAVYNDLITQSLYANVEHFICMQGYYPTKEEEKEILSLSDYNEHPRYKIYIEQWDQNYGTGEGNNRIIPKLQGKLVQKLDDDARIISPFFYENVIDIYNTLSVDAVISPYPVGLINNPGGPRAIGSHLVISGKENLYTLRPVHHIGGFARIAPRTLVSQYKWPFDLSATTSGNEAGNFSRHCQTIGIPMFYLENDLVVEHQESTLGQHERYGDEYFKGRY